MKDQRYPSIIPILLSYAAVLAIAVAVASAIDRDSRLFALVFRENGIVELLTVALYFLACVVIWRDRALPALLRAAFIICCLFLAGREMDLDTQFTQMSIVRTRFYFSPEIPFLERFWAALLVAVVGAGALFALVKCWPALVNGLKRFEAPAVLFVMGVLFMPLSKSLDKRAIYIDGAGLEIPGFISAAMLPIEEVMELLIPVSFLLASVLVSRRRQATLS